MNTHQARAYGIFSSSENPDELAATVKGIILTAGSLIIFFAAAKGVTITNVQVTEWASSIGASVGTLWAAYGVIRRAVIWLITKFHTHS